MRNVLVICAFFALTGCVLPPVLSYASMALDGVSYVATGKSVTDHALSAAVKQDCAVWRVVSEQDVEAVCQEYVGDDAGDGIAIAFEAGAGAAAPPTDRRPVEQTRPADIVLATATPVEPPVELPVELFVTAAGPAMESDITAASEPLHLLLGIDPVKLPATPDSGPDFNFAPATIQSAPAAANRKAIYLVVGSFRTVDGAERRAAQMPGNTAAIAPTLAGDERYYRVVVGPYEPGQTGDAQLRLAAAGIGNTWAANLCIGDLGAPPCDASP